MHHLSKKKKHWQCIANQVQENRQAHWNFSDVSSDTGYYEICCSACKVKFNMSYNRIFPFRVHRRTKLTVIHLTVMLLKSGKLKFFLSLKGEKGKLAGFLLLSCTKLSKTEMFVSFVTLPSCMLCKLRLRSNCLNPFCTSQAWELRHKAGCGRALHNPDHNQQQSSPDTEKDKSKLALARWGRAA